MDTIQHFFLSKRDALTIQKSMSQSDGSWRLAVRWGSDWISESTEYGVLLDSEGNFIEEGLEGIELALFLGSETTKMGDIHTVFELCHFHSLNIIGEIRNPARILSLQELEQIPSLTSLRLNWCTSLTSISELENMKGLQSVHLNFCETLTDISVLPRLPNLTELSLGGCVELVDISIIGELKQLRSLDINKCTQLTDIQPLGKLKNLRDLNLSGCLSLEDISPIQFCTQLRTLTLGGRNSTLDNIAPVHALGKLENLDLSYCAMLEDISPLHNLNSLQQLNLSRCSVLSNIDGLTNLKQLHTLNLSFCGVISDISPLESLSNLRELDISRCTPISDISPLGTLKNLQILNVSFCTALRDISPLKDLEQLQDLDLSRCKPLSDITPLTNLVHLKKLNLSFCSSLQDISALANMEMLEELDLSRCTPLSDITPLTKLRSIHSLDLSFCKALSDISALESLIDIHTLDLSRCTPLHDISPLSMLEKLVSLDLSRTSIRTVEPLSSLKNLSKLTLGSCTGLTDVSPLRHIKSLDTLILGGKGNPLADVSPLGDVLNLRVLDLNNSNAITDISALSSLNRLEEFTISGPIDDISPLASLHSLRKLFLSGCPSLSDISSVRTLKSMHTLILGGKGSLLNDISPIQDLPELHTIDLSGCNELADQSTWYPLLSLHSLQIVKGSFPSYYTSKILARNATNRQDWGYIQKNKKEWLIIAEQFATEPALLSIIGKAFAVHPNGYTDLAKVIALSRVHDAPDIDGLFSIACPLVHAPVLDNAIQRSIEQEDFLLPPETLVALHKHMLEQRTLKENTITAIIRSFDSQKPEPWSQRTAISLRKEMQHSRYPLNTSLLDRGLEKMMGVQFNPTEGAFFGLLCCDHIQSTNIEWRNSFQQKLCDLALLQQDKEIRNQALSDITAGLSMSSDDTWVTMRLGYILQAAAEIDPDTSALHASVSHAYAIGGNWDKAYEIASAISNPKLRDEAFKDLSSLVLDSDIANRMQLAISFEIQLSSPKERGDRLFALGFHNLIYTDLVAYGILLGHLTEYPEKQQRLAANFTKNRPDIMQPDPTVSPDAKISTSQHWLQILNMLSQETYDELYALMTEQKKQQ